MVIRGVEIAHTAAGRGRPFLWGHGVTSSRAHEDETGLFDWRALESAARVVRYDARGHGESGGTTTPEHYRWSDLALDMLGVADALGLERFVAGGASMGCATALFAALAAPERIDALVLVIPPTAWETRAPQAGLYETMADLVAGHGLAHLAALGRQQPLPGIFAREFPAVLEIGMRHLGAMNEETFPALFRGAARSDFPERAALRGLAMPALILAWAEDDGHPLSTADALAELLPDARLHVARSLAEIRVWPERIDGFLSDLGATTL